MKRRVMRFRVLTTVVASLAACACLSAGAQGPGPEEAARRYLALPREVDVIVTSTVDERTAKSRLRQLFATVFADPQLEEMLSWLDGVSLHSDAIASVMTSIRHMGPERPVRFVRRDAREAQLQTEVRVVETYGLGHNLGSVGELFERHPISNAQLEGVARMAKASSDPDRITFEVTSENGVELSVRFIGSDWKVTTVSVTPRSSTLRLSP